MLNISPAPATPSVSDTSCMANCDLEDEPDMEVKSEYMPRERPTRLVVPAAGQPLPDTWGLCSVFDLAFLPIPPCVGAAHRPSAPKHSASTLQKQNHTKVTREQGVVRCQRLHHTETPAWKDQETARRARQKPPRPPKKAKTISRKLAELVGAGAFTQTGP